VCGIRILIIREAPPAAQPVLLHVVEVRLYVVDRLAGLVADHGRPHGAEKLELCVFELIEPRGNGCRLAPPSAKAGPLSSA
jgi:hypothetical protein